MKFVFDFIMTLLVSGAVAIPIMILHEKWKKEMEEEQQEN